MTAIIDSHHHIWRLEYLAWLNGPTQPRIFGDYDAIKKDYPVNEFQGDLKESGVVASVYIQVNWPAGGEVDEAAWVQSVADQSGWPNAIVGYAYFGTENCRDVLKKLGRFPPMRDVRQQLHWHENITYRFAPAPDVMNDAAWWRNFAALQNFGWTFELQVFASQMKDAATLAGDFPEIQMILQHCGMPEDRSGKGMELWRDGMKRLADQPNVHCKLSGLGTFIHRNDSAFIADITAQSLEFFGADRFLFGSNFPIEKLWTDYASLVDAFRDALAGLNEGDRNAIFFTKTRSNSIDPIFDGDTNNDGFWGL